MHEAFTENARKVLKLAHQEADLFFGTEHLLLGLIGVDSCLASDVLAALNVDRHAIRSSLANLVQGAESFDDVFNGKTPETPAARRAIAYAAEEARNHDRDRVGTEHILAALLREENGVAAQVLMNHGLTLEAVRTEIPAALARRKHEGTK